MTDKALKPPTEAAMAVMGKESWPAGVAVFSRPVAVGLLLRRSRLELVIIMSRWVGLVGKRERFFAQPLLLGQRSGQG